MRKLSESDVEFLLAPGTTLCIRFQAGNPNNRTLHVRAIVDDEQVVCRFWRSPARGWDYTLFHCSYLRALAHSGNLYMKEAPER